MRLDIGLIGASAIALRTMVAPSARHDDTAVVAVAASDPDRSASFASAHGIPAAHQDYAGLIEDPRINTVYISLQNSAHCKWATRAALAGKHVIVEKPLCLDQNEFAQISAAASATGVRFIEAVATEGHEWQTTVGAFVAEGVYGALRSTRSRIQFLTPSADSYRCRPDLGGGIFLDASSYWLQAVQAICGLGDAAGSGQSDFAGPNGVDKSFHARLSWPNGRESVLESCFAAKHIAEHEFFFERATVRLRNFLLPVAGRAPLNLLVSDKDSTCTLISFAPVAYYDRQFDRIRALLTGRGDAGEEEPAGERVRLMAAVYDDARRRRTETPTPAPGSLFKSD